MIVTKRNGTKENLDYSKIHQVIEWAVDGTENTSVSQIELGAKIQFTDGIKTSDIHDMLIKSTVSLITKDERDYAKVAAKLWVFKLRKQLFRQYEPPSVKSLFTKNIEIGVYDNVLAGYTDEDFELLESIIDHDRDLTFEYAGLSQFISKYLVKDRSTGEIYETPQFAYLAISCTLFGKDFDKVKKFYDQISTFKMSLPTPIMSGVRTLTRQFSSCVLIDSDDSLESINSTASSIVNYVSQRAGIGINAGRIRSIGSKVRNGEVMHTGVIPFLKYFKSALKSCSQGGVRGGAATVFYPWWHSEIESLIMLKNENGVEETREHKLDYGIQLNEFFLNKAINNETVSIFSPHDVPELYESFFVDNFEEVYDNCVKNFSIDRKEINALDLLRTIVDERNTTGRIFIHFVDNVYNQGMYTQAVYQSNLCMEIVLPTTPVYHEQGTGDIQLCTLAAVNLAAFDDPTEMKETCEILVEALNIVIDYQNYPVKVAERTTKRFRPLGIGVINLATLLAKNGLKYGSDDALKLVDMYLQHMSYYLIDASVELNKIKQYDIEETLYNKGLVPLDLRKESIDDLVEHVDYMEWGGLKTKLKRYGIANSALMAVAPTESSSQISNSTNGVEIPRDFVSYKKSKDGVLPQVVPGLPEGMEHELLFDTDCVEYLKTIAVIQKNIDQSISTNTWYSPDNLTGRISENKLIKDILTCHKLGIKTLYYSNNNDKEVEICEGCTV